MTVKTFSKGYRLIGRLTWRSRGKPVACIAYILLFIATIGVIWFLLEHPPYPPVTLENRREPRPNSTLILYGSWLWACLYLRGFLLWLFSHTPRLRRETGRWRVDWLERFRSRLLYLPCTLLPPLLLAPVAGGCIAFLSAGYWQWTLALWLCSLSLYVWDTVRVLATLASLPADTRMYGKKQALYLYSAQPYTIQIHTWQRGRKQTMLTMVTTDGVQEYELLRQLEARSGEVDKQVTAAVTEILETVKTGGDQAVREYTRRFDGVDAPLRAMERAELKELARQCDRQVYGALERAAESIRAFHEEQVQRTWKLEQPDGSVVGQRVRGLHRVGIYVPGGTAAYPSSVLMNAIPARIAGVKEIVMVTPPPKDGQFNADVMAAAYIAGVDRVFLCGGAQAVAALAYGTETVPKVDKIVGPGNIYVATAKKLVYGVCDIDMIAGPSEILVLADDYADPACLAADLMSQAEHDVLASAILITNSSRIARETVREIERQIEGLSRKSIIERSLRDYGAILICQNMDEAVEFANRLAPEHLEVMCDDPMQYLDRLDNAGSIFLGQYSPEPLGDYYAGPNHVLPTGGTARFFSPLSVDSFVKKSGFIRYTEEGLRAVKDDVMTIANAEGLTAHAQSIAVRFP